MAPHFHIRQLDSSIELMTGLAHPHIACPAVWGSAFRPSTTTKQEPRHCCEGGLVLGGVSLSFNWRRHPVCRCSVRRTTFHPHSIQFKSPLKELSIFEPADHLA